MEVITINISSQELQRRQERLDRAARFEPVDFVPVTPGLFVRYWLPKIGFAFGEYFTDPETMLRAQLYAKKWLLENVQSDLTLGGVAVDFQNVREAGSLGCEVQFPQDDLIWIGEGWLRDEEDLEELRGIDPVTTGLQAKAVKFAERMRALGSKYVVRLQDGVELRPGETAQLPSGSMGPFTVAGHLAGITELLAAVAERPAFVREFLGVVTEKIIQWMVFCRKVQAMDSLWIADDYAGNLSPGQFREFVLPCLEHIRACFPGLPFHFHMCGKVDHLLPILAHELGISCFSLFGYQLDKALVQKLMGGRIVLVGNVNPMNIYGGTPASVAAEAWEALEVFGRGRGGFILADGANIPPDSPLENINAMYTASREFARLARMGPADDWSGPFSPAHRDRLSRGPAVFHRRGHYDRHQSLAATAVRQGGSMRH